MIYRMTIYEADDTTTWLQVSTDREATNPWLMVPEQWAETEIDFASGSASIGEIVVQVLDPQTGGTQAVRGFTAKLRDSSGRSAMSGRRAKIEDSVDGATYRLIFDGVIQRVELADSLASFFVTIRDIRERERLVQLFRTTDTCTVLPAGVLEGYGIPYAGADESEWLVPPTAPLTGVFRLDPAQIFGEGFVDLSEHVIGATSEGVPVVRPQVIMSDAAIAASQSTGEPPRIRVLWRAEGSTGSFTVVNVGSFVQGSGSFVPTIAAWVGSEDGRPVNAASRVAMPNGFGLANTLPTNGQRVEVIVQYIGETLADWPLHIEGVTAGELIADIYDGVYSDDDPRIRYDAASIAALNTPIRARITAPVDDAREWVERNLYVAAGAAPAIIGGEVHAVTYELPPAGVSVTELANAEVDVAPGWAQASDDAINVVTVTYPRDRSIAPDEPGYESAPGDRIVSRDVTIDRNVPESIGILGIRQADLRVDVLRAIGGPQGEPYSGDVADETGAQVAQRIAAMMTDRFALGGQTFVVLADRTDTDVEALQVGDWVLIATTWTPDYATGERGGNRIGQIIARRDESPIRTELLVLDGGPNVQPFAAPTLGTITQNDLGQIVVPIATVPTGAQARVDYAISTSQPATGSSLWTFAGRAGGSESVTTPQLPSGRKVWIRARSEGVSVRPSAYTTPVSVDVTARVRLRRIFGFVTDAGIEIHWRANPATQAVRIEYVAHPFGVAPDYSEGDTVDTDASPELLTDAFDRGPGQVLSFRVTPYPGFSGGSVTGAAGQPLERSVFIGLPGDEIPFGSVIAFIDGLDLEFQAQGNAFAAGGKYAIRIDDPPEDPDDPNADVTGSFEGPFTFEQVQLSQVSSYGDVWVGVWFYSDYDESLDEPVGLEGPKVLARATQQPLAGTFQPDMVARIEYDEDSDGPIARVIATVSDPFLRARAVDPMEAYTETGPVDAIPPLDDAAWIAQPIETGGPYDGSYVWEVPLTEKHLSVAALAFYWLDADGTERVIAQVFWLDVGDDANITNITVSYDNRDATVVVTGDADTVELYAQESTDGDPDGTWSAVTDPTPAFTGDRFATSRTGSFMVQTRTDRERFFRVYGRNADGRDGPFAFFATDRAVLAPPPAPPQVAIPGARWDRGRSDSTSFFDRQISLDIVVGTDVRSIRVGFGPTVSPTGSPIEGFRDTDVDGSTVSLLRDVLVREETGTPGAVVDFPPEYDAPTQVTVTAYDAVGGGAGAGATVGQAVVILYPDEDLTTIVTQVGTDAPVVGDRLRIGAGLTLSTVSGNPEISASTTGVTSLTGTTNRVTVSASTGAITLDTPQDTHTSATPTFAGITLNGNVTTRAPLSTTAPTHVAVFSASPTSTTARELRVRTPTQLRGDLGAGTVNNVDTGVGLTGGPITDTGVISLDSTASVTFASVTVNGNLAFRAAASSTNAATQIPVFTASPATTTRTIVTRTPAQLRSDIGAGTVTQVDGKNGITGSVTTSGDLELVGQASAFHNLAFTGLVTKTGNGTAASRTITAGTGITVTNGDGVSGNPTVALNTADVVTSISGTANQIIASSPAGGVTLSTPQNIHTSATPTFGGATLNGSLGMRAAATTSTATQIPVFTASPAATTRTVVTRTPAQLRGDIGAAATLHDHDASAIISGTLINTVIPDLDAVKITSGTFNTARIPNLDANKITTGTLGTDRIPNLDAAKITTGTLNDARIPNLAASKITSGTFDTARIPNLDAAKITTGTLGVDRIPNLDAAKITTGTFNTARIPNLDANKITSGTLDTARLNANIADVTVQGSGPTGTPARAGSLWFVV